MLLNNSEKKAFVLDYGIVNDTSTCFDMISKLSKAGNVFINYDFVTSSANNKLKNYIVFNGILAEDDVITIKNDQVSNNIVTHDVFIKKFNKQHDRNNILNNMYEKLRDQQYSVTIYTLSMNVMLECKLSKVNCELYNNTAINNVGFYNCNDDNLHINSDPKENQFKYNHEDKTLEKFSRGNWKFVDNSEIYGFNPLSYRQKAYLDLLLDDSINLVLCSGPAGTGKTFMACLAGIHKMLEVKKYTNMVLSRATIDIGDNSIGFLPGSKEEKMSHWIQPMKDNLDTILKKVNDIHGDNDSEGSSEIESIEYSARLTLSKKQRKKQQKNVRRTTSFSYVNSHKKSDDKYTVESLMKNKQVNIECLSFFRGRTFTDTFCIIDEAQNLTMHEIKTIITRIGSGSKLVMIGDIEQSDLKHKNTDFCDVINKMMGHEMVGVVQLDKSLRSGLASLAVSIL
jgi:predicted ribonuclease YlaK